MNPINYLIRKARSLAKVIGSAPMAPARELTQREFCDLMRAYYDNNDLYANVGIALREVGQWSPSIKGMRNPTFDVVEFYAATVWPGETPAALPIVADDEALKTAIADVWSRSNWSRKKQLAVREGAITGDAFLKVAVTDSGKPFIQALRSKNIVDWDCDERGNVTWIRYEERLCPRDATSALYHVEIWDANEFKIWQHEKGFNCDLERMGPPMKQGATPGFVPFVHIPFRDAGDRFGVPAIWNCWDKIDECNLKATRLSELLFRYGKPMLALSANQVDNDGRPMPAPRIALDGDGLTESQSLTVKDDQIIRLPGNSTLQHLLADVKFDAHLAALEADLAELKRDLPEVMYYDLMQSSNVSGRALAYMLAPAVARVREVRGNFERGLVLADRMAVTLGKLNGMYDKVGTFESGALDHTFAERDILPVSEADRADMTKVYVDMGVPLVVALKREGGWSDDDLATVKEEVLNEVVVKASQTAGPLAPVETQSAVRAAVVSRTTPAFESALTNRIGTAVEGALAKMPDMLAAFLAANK